MKRLILILALLLALTPTAAASTTDAPGPCHWERKPRLRCQCGDNLYSPWLYCVRRTS